MVPSHWQASQIIDLTMETHHEEARMEDGSMELDDKKYVSDIMTRLLQEMLTKKLALLWVYTNLGLKWRRKPRNAITVRLQTP